MNDDNKTTASTSIQVNPPRLLKGRLLRGCNTYHRDTVFAQRFDPGTLGALDHPGLSEDLLARLRERFDKLSPPPVGLPGNDASTMRFVPGMSLADALLVATLAVERFLATAMSRFDQPQFARVTPRGRRVELAWDSRSAAVSSAAVQAAFLGLIELLPTEFGGQNKSVAKSFATAVKKLQRRFGRRRWSMLTATIALAAKQRQVPHEVLSGNYIRLGDGSRQQLVSESSLEGSAAPAGSRLTQGSVAMPPGVDQHRFSLLTVGAGLVSALRREPRINAGAANGHGDPSAASAALSFDGGSGLVDVTADVHASVREAAVACAKQIGAAIVTLRLTMSDISQPFDPARDRLEPALTPEFIEQHALHGIRRGNRVGTAFLDLLTPGQQEARIATALIVGDRGTRTVARALARVLRAHQQGVGLALSKEVSVQGQRNDPTARGRSGGLRALFRDPRVSVAVSAASTRVIVRRGLQSDHCTVLGLLPPKPGADLEAYSAGLQVALSSEPRTVVVGADHPRLAFIQERVPHARIALVGKRVDDPIVAAHLAAGGMAVTPETPGSGADIVLQQRGVRLAAVSPGTLRMPDTRGRRGRVRFAAAMVLATQLVPDVAAVGSPR